MTASLREFGLLRTLSAPRFLRATAVSLLAIALANCGGTVSKSRATFDSQQAREFGAFKDPRYGKASPRVVSEGTSVPKGGGRYQVGRPYKINGKVYRPYQKPDGFTQSGSASWYGAAFHGRKTANGEVYDRRAFSAAHPTMPLPSYARVTNLRNGNSIVVRVNDRGPYHGGRIIDLSERTAEVLDFKSSGTARVQVSYIGKASLAGSDDRQLLASLRRDGRPASLDTRTQIVAAEPEFTPAPARRSVPRVAASTLPGFEANQTAASNTSPDETIILPRKKRVDEPMVAMAAPATLEPAAAFASTEPADDGAALSINAAAVVSGNDETGIAPASESLSALYYTGEASAAQPAAKWRVRMDNVQPLGAAKVHQGGAFMLSAGIFRNVSNAQRLARLLDGAAPVMITKIELNGSIAYSVSAGPFDAKADAEETLNRAIGAGATGARLRRS